MINKFTYVFWIWSTKLNPVLSMLSYLADYNFSKEDREVIELELKTTNDEQNVWNEYILNGKKHTIQLRLANDSEEGSSMIHLELRTSKKLKQKLEALNLFQSIFKELIE
jgi:hypothetical protein